MIKKISKPVHVEIFCVNYFLLILHTSNTSGMNEIMGTHVKIHADILQSSLNFKVQVHGLFASL